ncbi:nectin-2 isoform X2 [Hyperolius riggenbachi]|uniref:nectin-2 isoform X2 n=1 Tax=Hyperolius riggenbachi TaxID=752182 RepID=UPI0035A3AD56
MQCPLYLLLLLCAGLQAQVNVQEKLTGLIGQEVILPCTFRSNDPNIRVSQIMWMKDGRSVAVYSPQHGTHVTDNSFQLLEPSQSSATLRIMQARAKDEGDYTCEVTVFPDGNLKAISSLVVKAQPQNSAQANTEAIANGEEQTVATCKSANGRPPSQITWQTSIPGNVTTTMTNNTDGTYTVVSQYALIPTSYANELPINCIINHDSTDTNIPFKLSILFPPEVTIEGFDDNWHLKRSRVHLTCSAKGNPPPTMFTWKTADGSPLPSTVQQKGNILYVNEVDLSVNTSFLCEVTNALGSRAYRQDVLVRETPNYSGAGATGGIIGGIIAAIVGIAVVATIVMIYRQQRKNQTAKDDEDLEGPPAYKPPPPSIKQQFDQPAEEVPLKSTVLPPQPTEDHDLELNGKTLPKYQVTPETPRHSAYDDDYLEQENPIYNEYRPSENGLHQEEEPDFVMSPAVYV